MIKEQNKRLIVLAAGGTGGHIFPAEAVAEKLREHNYDTKLICDKRVVPLLEGAFLEVEKVVVMLAAPKSSLLSKIKSIVALLFSTIKILWMFLKNRPKLVISFGGYPTLPAALSAVILRVPLVLHEQNSSLGLVNWLFLPFARHLCTSFPSTRKIKKKYSHKVLLTGLPLRNKIIKCIKHPKIQPDDRYFRILVIGGSQGAKLFSDVIPNAIAKLDKSLQERIQITQQVRNELINTTIAIYKETYCKYEVKPFFHNIAELYRQHDLVITRAGASSMAELMSFQKAAIIVPFAKAKDNHQYYNAKFLEDSSQSIVIEEKDFSINRLSNHLREFLKDPEKIRNMEAAYNLAYSSIHVDASSNLLTVL